MLIASDSVFNQLKFEIFKFPYELDQRTFKLCLHIDVQYYFDLHPYNTRILKNIQA